MSKIDKIGEVIAHGPEQVAIIALVALGRWGAPRWGVGRTVSYANQAALYFGQGRSETPEAPATVEIARICALRASRVVSGANCLHRAFALRIWLAREGIRSRIVIGFRKRKVLEGHAWLEIQLDSEDVIPLFHEEDDGYHEVADEELISRRMRFS